MRQRLFYCPAMLIVGALACSNGDGTGVLPPLDSSLTFSGSVQPIFTRTCAFATGCHAGPDAQQGMDLSAGQAYSNVVNMPSMEVPRLFRIAPSNADSSYLVLKIQGRAGLVDGVGTRMPLGGSLTQAQIDTIVGWVAAGARNN